MKNVIQKLKSRTGKVVRKAKRGIAAIAVGFGLSLAATPAQAQLPIIGYDDSTDTVSFAPQVLVDPLANGAVTIIGSAVILALIGMAFGLTMKYLRRSRG